MLEGCMIVGRDWCPLYVNEAAARHRHRDRSEMLGRSLFEIYPDSESAEDFARFLRCMESRVGERFETTYMFEDGSRAWYDVSVQPVLEGILVLTIDRTAERLAAIEHENAAARDRLLVQEGADGICRIDATGRILDVNPAYLDILGRDEDAVRGHRIQEFFVPGDELPLRIPAGEDEAGLTAERWLVRADGRRVLQAARLHLLPDGTVLVSARDITLDRERAERQEEASRLEALGRLAGGIAHDFNNLMTTVIGTADLLLASTPDTDLRHTDIEAIREAGARAAALTNQPLAFGRRQLLRPRIVDVRSLLDQVARLLERTLREDMTLTVDVAADASVAKVDPAQLEQIATNLVLNAQEALPAGGTVSIATTRVEVTSEQAAGHPEARPGPFIRLDVTDNGSGIDSAVLPHVFEPFFTTKEFGHGFGLGLSAVVGIAGQSGGWVEVRSAAGVGTVFSVFLPAGPEEAAHAPGAATVPGVGHETILLVEDEPQVRAVAARILGALGYRVIEAATAAEALGLDSATLDGVDLLMTDVVLPDSSGLAVAERLAGRRPNLRTLFVSGYTSTEALETRMAAPGTGFLAKPYRREDLAAALRRLLAEAPR
jgi:two-component system cell cycle sensor histidine kinase/response regulator CckA